MTLLLDVGDTTTNIVLNLTFVAIALVTLISLILWRLRGGRNRWTRYLPLCAIGLYVVYEAAMPPNWDIRLDLFLLAPMGLSIFLAWGVRVICMAAACPWAVGLKSFNDCVWESG